MKFKNDYGEPINVEFTPTGRFAKIDHSDAGKFRIPTGILWLLKFRQDAMTIAIDLITDGAIFYGIILNRQEIMQIAKVLVDAVFAGR